MLVVCTGCNSKMRVPDTAAGKRVKCPKCQTVIQVPLTEEPAAPPSPPPPPAPVEAADDPFAAMSEAPIPSPVSAADEDAAPPPPRRRSRRDEEDEDDDLAAPPPSGAASGKKNLSMAALICGILGIVCCGCTPLSIAAIVLGIMAPKQEPAGKQLALIGLILGSVGLVLQLVGTVSYFFFVPNVRFVG